MQPRSPFPARQRHGVQRYDDHGQLDGKRIRAQLAASSSAPPSPVASPEKEDDEDDGSARASSSSSSLPNEPRVFRRPCGRAPKGKQWCYQTGEWISGQPAAEAKAATPHPPPPPPPPPAAELMLRSPDCAGVSPFGAPSDRGLDTGQIDNALRAVSGPTTHANVEEEEEEAMAEQAEEDEEDDDDAGGVLLLSADGERKHPRHSSVYRLLPRTPHFNAIHQAATSSAQEPPNGGTTALTEADVGGGGPPSNPRSPLKRIQDTCKDIVMQLAPKKVDMNPFN